MLTETDVPTIAEKVRRRLADAEAEGVYLRLVSEKFEDEWLYLVVDTARPGVRAIDHSDTMGRIEHELRREGITNVLLVPTLEDY